MIFSSVLAFSLLSGISKASKAPSGLGFGIHSLGQRDPTALGPMSQLHLANGVIAPDGYSRSAALIDNAFPGPLIQAKKNDTFVIPVVNRLTDDAMSLETSIHFHGIFQHKSNWADGAPYVTQCPLHPQDEFVYKFKPTGQTGTYWYHSHYAAQRCHGLAGPLVIYDDEDPLRDLYDVDDENTIITIADWYHSPDVPSKVFGFPNSTLVNGRGRYPGGPPAPLSVISFRQGLRYRLRVIAMSCEASFNFTIDGHRMTIIEVDGNEVEPVDVDSIPILPGQRYSVVISADQPVGNYWIRALSDLPDATFDDGQNMAILRYEGAANKDPISDAGPYELAFNEGDLHPLAHPGVPGIPEIGKADVNLVLPLGFTPEGNFTLGNVTYISPTVPVLLQILSGARQASELLPHGSVYTLPPNKVIEISFPHPEAAPGAPHPMHLHGNAFYVVRASGSNGTNFVDPVLRDVVSTGDSATDNVTIRFTTDNPGPWFLHCHIDYHLAHGLAVVMVAAPNETAQLYGDPSVTPQEWYKLCPKD